MANKLTLSESTIRSYTTSNSFERGYAYYERGDVLLVVQRGNLLLAEVAGSEYRPYEVQVTLGGMVTAVNWARRARDIYLLHQRQTEWHNYLSVRRFVA